MSLEINPLGFLIGNADADLSEGATDAIEELFSNARIDAAVGKAGTAVSLRRETQDINATATKLLKHDAPAAPAVRVTDDTLSKSFGTHSERRRAYVRTWLAGELALNKSVGELANYARSRDPETAALIEEIGSELEAA